jgi:hypothetical protein
VIVWISWFVTGGKPLDLFVASGTIGTLILLVAYALTTLGAARLLFFSGAADACSAVHGRREVAAWEVVIPTLALLLIGYTLFRNVDPYPHGAAGAYPVVSAAWILSGVVGVWARPGVARQAGVLLTTREGLQRPHPGPRASPSTSKNWPGPAA